MNARGPKGPRRSWRDTDLHLFDPVHESTSAQDKLWNYVRGAVEKPEIVARIKLLRKKFGIPHGGLSTQSRRPSFEDILEIDLLRQDLDLDMQWIITLASYVFYNKLEWHSSFGGLLEVHDAGEGYRPIAIRVSPYASQRDIIDYVRKIYKAEIEPLQEKYKKEGVLIGSINKRNIDVGKIKDFIYKNRGKTSRQIVTLIHERFGKTMDYSYVSKIRREEIAKRK